MCRRFKLIYNIESSTVEDILQYLQGMFRLYCIFFVISIINLALNYSSNLTLGLSIAGVVLYAINMGMVKFVVDNPAPQSVFLPMLSTIILCLFNIANLVITILLTGSYWGLFSLLGVALQSSTIYILYKLREKLLGQQQNQAVGELHQVILDVENPKTPIKSDYK